MRREQRQASSSASASTSTTTATQPKKKSGCRKVPSHNSRKDGSSSKKPKAPTMPMQPSSSSLPPAARVRLYELFVQIEREFEQLYAENVALQERLDRAERRNQQQQQHSFQSSFYAERSLFSHSVSNPDGGGASGVGDSLDTPSLASSVAPLSAPPTAAAPALASHPSTASSSSAKPHKGFSAHKLRSHTSRLRAQTNRLMSNLKAGSGELNCGLVRRYAGHKDGVWEVSAARTGQPIVGTASADHTAMVWGMHSGRALLQYTGHSGSVNSLRFHPNKELVLTASGDGSAHIWQCAVHLSNESSSGRVASSEDELDPNEKDGGGGGGGRGETDEENQFSVLRTPLRSLTGHTGVVIAADWLPGGEQAVTAGWDRHACIWDTQTGEMLHQLSGHDEELTHAAAHPTSRLVVTASKDSTFRLWDFREAIHSVSVFQGHQDTVTSAIFTSEANQVVSGSDDRSARIWDLRNMRTPVAVVQSDSSVNRLSVSQSGLIAIPFDNRNVRIYDLNGTRIARLPRSSRQGHSRMVCCTAWSEDTKPNLFTCGFDRMTLGWSVQPREVHQHQQQQHHHEEDRLNLSLRSAKDFAAIREASSSGGAAMASASSSNLTATLAASESIS